MRLFALPLLLVVLILSPLASLAQPKKPRNPNIADTPPLAPADQVKTFHLPPGFVIELVAADPDVKKPININFDAMGRLWVTGSEEYPFPAPGDRKAKDTVKILSDFGPDGRARKITTFADGLNIPIGVQPLADGKSALVFSIPNIYLMRDNDGDGIADERKILYTGFGHKDTHGMTGEFQYWLDGWIYCCHGFSNTSKVKGQGATQIGMQSGNTYRIKPDGSRVEQFTWGQVNPFGLTFDPRGFLYSADCHSRPLYHLLKGGYYPSFGKPHDGLGFAPPMVNHDHGSTAICGLAYYTDDHFPPEFRDNVFIGNVVTNRINRDRIELTGASPKGILMPDFVTCDDPWFRPVDIKLGPDGALYVADFYNRIIGHYEVPLDHPGRDREKGRIWRIRYAGKDGKNPLPALVDYTKQSSKELVKELANPNLTARMLVTQVLVARNDKEAVDAISNLPADAPDGAIVAGMWVLERTGKMDDAILRRFHKRDGLVRSHVLKLLAEREKLEGPWHAIVVADLKDKNALVRRAAAEALSVHPTLENVRPLLDLRHAVPPGDPQLLHVVRMALRNQLKSKPGPLGLDAGALSEQDQRALADVCLGLPDDQAAAFLREYLTRFKEEPGVAQRYAHHIVRYGAEDGPKWVLDFAQDRFAADLETQGRFLGVVQKARQERGAGLGKEERLRAGALVANLLKSRLKNAVGTGVDLAGSLRLAGTDLALLDIARSPKISDKLRIKAVSALVAIEPEKHLPSLSAIIMAEGPFAVREQIVNAVASLNQPAAREVLLKAMETVPARLQTVIANGLAGTPQGAEELLKTIAAGKASPRLLTEPGIQVRLQQTKLPMLSHRIATLTKGIPPADARLFDQQIARRKSFTAMAHDASKGKAIFQKHCAACHQIGTEGAKVGPQLDGVGNRGVERILEDILDPNRNVDQAFRASFVTTKAGQVLSGLLLRKDGKVLVLADATGKELRIPEEEIEEQRLVNISPMPATFFEAIPEGDFHDLIAYLMAQRVK